MDENVHGLVMNFNEFVLFRGGGGLAFFCQKTWGVAYTRGAAYTSEYGTTLKFYNTVEVNGTFFENDEIIM